MVLECYKLCKKYRYDEALYGKCVDDCMNGKDRNTSKLWKSLLRWLYYQYLRSGLL